MYYEVIYALETLETEADCADLLKDVQLPRLFDEDRETLETELAEEEVCLALQSLHSGMPEGPNSLPAQLFMMNKVEKHMLGMFQEVRKEGGLPVDQRAATIVVIPKIGKPPTECGSYRPMSLLNMEVKVLMKGFATRLQMVFTKITQLNQYGSMPLRSMRLNLRRLEGVLHTTNIPDAEQVALCSLDAKMVFDCVEPYIFATFERLGFVCGFVAGSDFFTGK
ncbi:hypothetical protein NDU88_001962 [Pleurodeles waltl]|uniref:Reverse transcriptase domain-containing protein n=1 Tax=Pleurodeles waltl TaxID=8319 RepID=A0AAV7PCQ3_PLEWA|nr:hypothetical protein NDU88_001962 [Pleurodeles waltl]